MRYCVSHLCDLWLNINRLISEVLAHDLISAGSMFAVRDAEMGMISCCADVHNVASLNPFTEKLWQMP